MFGVVSLSKLAGSLFPFSTSRPPPPSSLSVSPSYQSSSQWSLTEPWLYVVIGQGTCKHYITLQCRQTELYLLQFTFNLNSVQTCNECENNQIKL